MRPVQPTPLPQSTLFETYAPVERYLRSLELTNGSPPAPPVKLQAIDAYVLHLMASMLPESEAIVDLAGPATWGASTVLWSSRDRGGSIYAPTPESPTGDDGRAWTTALGRHLEESRPAREVIFFHDESGSSHFAGLPGCLAAGRRPVLISLATRQDDPEGMHKRVDSIFASHPSAIVLMLPVGPIGEDPALEPLLGWTRLAGVRLTLLRELSPFLASSRMAVLYRPEGSAVPDALKRIRWLFTGNFDFLTLAHQTYTLSQANAKLDAEAKTSRARCAELEQSTREWESRYRELAERERTIAERAHAMETRLILVTNGSGWALLQKLMWLRFKLFPRGSVRERVGRSIMQGQRRLRRGLSGLRRPRPRMTAYHPLSPKVNRARSGRTSVTVDC